MEQLLDVGKIVNVHGVKGEVKVIPFTDYPERFEELEWVYADRKGECHKLTIQSVKYFKNFVILKCGEIRDMTQAESYKDVILKIDRANSIKLPEGSFLICDIIGLKVYTLEDEYLGTVGEVLQTGSNDVYIVKREGKKDILIPALKAVVTDIDPEGGRMTVKLPEGLVDDEI